MELKKTFDKATQDIKTLTRRPSNDDLLELYALFKQSTEGDAKGSRPGMFDLKGRAKFDAWSSKKGTSMESAMAAYVSKVESLLKS